MANKHDTSLSKYCSRYLDDAPGIRGDCARRLEEGLQCEDCPHRNIHQEVTDLRNKLQQTASEKVSHSLAYVVLVRTGYSGTYSTLPVAVFADWKQAKEKVKVWNDWARLNGVALNRSQEVHVDSDCLDELMEACSGRPLCEPSWCIDEAGVEWYFQPVRYAD